ncbi:YidH family protein [Microcoleus sp. FACHB-672]|uniref:YidH family protein n=1 Tax=Microcoleus sp. FACHB-672 TaxID=2692825 RepID=UPI001683CDF3|nr:DUF202 domain-containing protein [Microcoleus sp. FACHB-672]MBD2040635.1 DUF202 domain-containing protein [Microcoleus sp. FACHB-672]
MSDQQRENVPKIDRQREHQANERTFLAWLRTSIALIGFGFAISRFGLFLRQLQISITGKAIVTHSFLSSETLGINLALIGIILIALATWRYNQVFWQIERADYKPNRLLVWMTATIVMIFGAMSIPSVLWRQPVSPSSPSPKRSDVRDREFMVRRLPPRSNWQKKR